MRGRLQPAQPQLCFPRNQDAAPQLSDTTFFWGEKKRLAWEESMEHNAWPAWKSRARTCCWKKQRSLLC